MAGPWRVAVTEASMLPAIEPGDWLFVNPRVHAWPRPGAVVVFREPMTDALALKRVAAGPGERVRFAEGFLTLAVRILDRLAADGSAARLAKLVREYAAAGRPILTVGCGTSEHGAQGVAEILSEALGVLGSWTGAGESMRPTAVQAFEALEDLAFAPGARSS